MSERTEPGGPGLAVGYVEVPRPSLWMRLWWRLLPPTHHSDTWEDIPEGYGDILYAESGIRFGLVDRLRVLFWGRLEVRHEIAVEHRPGRSEARLSLSTR